jgi:hypothetical protein
LKESLFCEILFSAKTTVTTDYFYFRRLLLLAERGGDNWSRTDELLDHLEEKGVHPQGSGFF